MNEIVSISVLRGALGKEFFKTRKLGQENPLHFSAAGDEGEA